MVASDSARITVILGFKNAVVAEVYGLAFEGIWNADVIVSENIETMLSTMQTYPECYVLMESDFLPTDDDRIFRCQMEFAKRSYLFILGKDENLLSRKGVRGQVIGMPAASQLKQIIERIDSTRKKQWEDEDFCRITLKSLFVRSAELRSDVYVRLAEGKFVKVLHMKDRFDLQEYERFRAKNIDALYLPRKEFLELIQDLLAKIEGVNKDIQKVPLDEIIDTSMAVFQIVHLAIESDGFTPQLQSLTQECVKLAVGTIAKNPTLSELLSRFDKDRDSYLAWHSTALSFMVCKLAVVMGWESEATFYKLSLSALLHDLLLPTDELSKIQSIAELEKSNLPEEKAESFLRHPVDAGKLLQNMNNVPGDVAFIIEQHHELPEGTGFPRGIGYKDISAISALFIIAHDAVATMYASPPEKFSYPQFLKLRKIEKIYAKGSFWQVFSKLIANKDI